MPIKLRINKTKPLDFLFIWEITCATFNGIINVHKYEKRVFGNTKLNIYCIINIHVYILFSMMFSAMLTDAFQDVDAGFPIRYRFDGKLLNLRRLQAKSKVQTDVVDKLLYADDLAENAKSEEKTQEAVDLMSKACDNFQLTISTKKD